MCLPLLSLNTNKTANVKCSFLELTYRLMCFFKVRRGTHFTLRSCARMPVTGNLQREAVIGRKGEEWELNLSKKVTSAGWQEKGLMSGQRLTGSGGLLVTD